MDNKELGREFRDLFLDRLDRLVRQGAIQLEDAGYISDLIGDLRDQDWVVFIEGPPKPNCAPEMMLKYLTRYLTGGPISDHRIVRERGGQISFTARSLRKGEGQVEVTLPAVEFVRRWCLHILPKEFTKTRFMGAWSGSKRREYHEQCQLLAPSQAPSTPGPEKRVLHQESPSHCCPTCQRPLECVEAEERPSWRELFYGPAHPSWYEWTSLGKCSPPDPEDRPPSEPIKDEVERAMLGELHSLQGLL